jgi:hypothetical protein
MLVFAIIAILSIALDVLLFAVGYLMGERNARVDAPKSKPIIEIPAAPPIIQVPKAPPAQNNQSGMKPLRIVSPREAIYAEQQKRDGLVPTPTPKPPAESIPPALKTEFLKDAEAVVASHG